MVNVLVNLPDGEIDIASEDGNGVEVYDHIADDFEAAVLESVFGKTPPKS